MNASDSRPKKFFFMHIAKTAGSFVNASLKKTLDEAFVEHCELPSRTPAPEHDLAGIRGWSGHIYWPNWRGIERRIGMECDRFTVVRDPIKHLASHILWIDHYNLPDYLGERARLPQKVQAIAKDLEKIDVSDAGDLDAYLTYLSGSAVQYFDNCQSRYFIAGTKAASLEEPLHFGHLNDVKREMGMFTVIGTEQDWPSFEEHISQLIGKEFKLISERVNEAKALRKIDTSNPDIATVLGKRVALDQWLFNRASTGRPLD